MSYVSGEAVVSRLTVRRERWPGGPETRGDSLVSRGHDVLPDQPVLRLTHPSLHQASPVLSLPLQVQETEIVPAGLHGRVVGLSERGAPVIESSVVRLKGAFGVGKQIAGILSFWPDGSVIRRPAIPPGAILVVPGNLTFMLLRQACASGVAGIVAGSIALCDLEGFLRTDLVRHLCSDATTENLAQRSPISLLLTEGIGQARMSDQLKQYLQQLQGTVALLTATTSWKYGRIPDLLISQPPASSTTDWPLFADETALQEGRQVRILSGEYQGMIGIIEHLYIYEQRFPSGVRMRAALLSLDAKKQIMLPLTAIERFA